MKKLVLGLGLSLCSLSVFAAAKPCEELKTEIAAKLDAKGVSGYTLEIVDTNASTGGQVVGTCEGGSKEIVYKK